MQLMFLVIQIILAIAIIGTVLLQKNSNDGLGSLSGSGAAMTGGNIISGRSAASFLTKATTILMFCFMVNSVILGNISARTHKSKLIVERVHQENINKETTKQDNSNKETSAPVSE